MLIVFVTGHPSQVAIAQLGECQTEDLKVPSSILGLGMTPLLSVCLWDIDDVYRCSQGVLYTHIYIYMYKYHGIAFHALPARRVKVLATQATFKPR